MSFEAANKRLNDFIDRESALFGDAPTYDDREYDRQQQLDEFCRRAATLENEQFIVDVYNDLQECIDHFKVYKSTLIEIIREKDSHTNAHQAVYSYLLNEVKKIHNGTSWRCPQIQKFVDKYN